MKRFWRTAPTWLLVVAGIGVLTVLSASYATYDYVQHDPDFCTSCHIMDDAYALWADSTHSEVTCHACHTPDLAANLRQLWVYLTDPPEKPTHRPEVENAVCYECHRTNGDNGHVHEGWENVLEQTGHAEHVGVQKIQCVRCHSTSLHYFEAPADLCKS